MCAVTLIVLGVATFSTSIWRTPPTDVVVFLQLSGDFTVLTDPSLKPPADSGALLALPRESLAPAVPGRDENDRDLSFFLLLLFLGSLPPQFLSLGWFSDRWLPTLSLWSGWLLSSSVSAAFCAKFLQDMDPDRALPSQGVVFSLWRLVAADADAGRLRR